MSKISFGFLTGFALMSFAGSAVADDIGEARLGALRNSLSAQSAAIGSGSTNSLKLNMPLSDLARTADALTGSTASASSLQGGLGGLMGNSLASAKLGSASSTPKTSADTALFANALSGASPQNLIAGRVDGSGAPAPTSNTVAALGVDKSALGSALGGQGAIATQRIGQ